MAIIIAGAYEFSEGNISTGAISATTMLAGRTVAPPLFETLAALGKQRALARIAAARDALAK